MTSKDYIGTPDTLNRKIGPDAVSCTCNKCGFRGKVSPFKGQLLHFVPGTEKPCHYAATKN